MFLLLPYLLISATCTENLKVKQNDIVQCDGYLVTVKAAEEAFKIVEDLYPKAVEKVSLLETKVSLLDQELKIDEHFVETLKSEIVIYKQSVSDLMEFSKNAVLEADKMHRNQSIIIVVSVGATIILMIGTILVVGYLAQSFLK